MNSDTEIKAGGVVFGVAVITTMLFGGCASMGEVRRVEALTWRT
jgi:uncharacterized membrane protein YedE/YeeE